MYYNIYIYIYLYVYIYIPAEMEAMAIFSTSRIFSGVLAVEFH